MITEMKIDFLYVEPAYKTFEEAAFGSARSARAARASEASATLEEEAIVAFALERRQVAFLLTSSRVLTIFCDGDLVDWTITDQPFPATTGLVFADEVQLTTAKRTYVWRPRQLLEGLKGGVGITLAPAQTLVSLYVRGCPDVLFAQMIGPGGEHFLYFDEE